MRYIGLTNSVKKARVSNEDYEFLAQFNWHIINSGYVRTSSSGPVDRLMHRVILARMSINYEGLDTNHINENKQDNRRDNLEVVTRSENMRHYHKVRAKERGPNYRTPGQIKLERARAEHYERKGEAHKRTCEKRWATRCKNHGPNGGIIRTQEACKKAWQTRRKRYGPSGCKRKDG